MSGFLKNLINRHQPSSARIETSVVEPRPKSRFENDTPSAVEPNGSEIDNVSSTKVSAELLHTNKDTQQKNSEYQPNQLEVTQPNSVADSLKSAPSERKQNPSNPNGIDDINARIQALSLQLGNKHTITVPKANGQINNRFSTSENNQGSINNETNSDNHNLSMVDGLSQKVESVIKRLASQNIEPKSAQSNSRGAAKTPSLVTHSEPDHKQHGPAKQIVPNEIEPILESASLQRESQQEPDTVPQTGLLQQPNWLTEMQSDLNQRWQDINAKTESTKPVVNVTIGRVEVRAVQDTKMQTPKMQQKPRGVMSLDDYLKSRDKQGRA